MIDLEGKVVAVSGAGSGIGRGLALKAAERGARVAVIDIDRASAEATAALVGQAGAQARAYQVDVADLDAMHSLAAAIDRDFGPINMLFNNAGVIAGGTLARTTPQDFAWMFDVNVRGLYNAIQAFLPSVERAAAAGDLAHIVNTGSENSVALPDIGPITAYTATKHAVLGLSDGLRRDLQDAGIRVSVICPGVVQTNIWNAKRVRQDRYGGTFEAPASVGGTMASGRTVKATVDTVFAGLDAGEFLIITDTTIRSFTERRIDDLVKALDRADERIKER